VLIWPVALATFSRFLFTSSVAAKTACHWVETSSELLCMARLTVRNFLLA
jgi:hypothetical protein